MARGRYSRCFCPQGEGSGPHGEPGHRGCNGLVSAQTGSQGTWELLEVAASLLTSLPTSPARLMEHEEDPDVDEPLATPLGHVLGREPTSSEQGGPQGPDRGTQCDYSRGLEEDERTVTPIACL